MSENDLNQILIAFFPDAQSREHALTSPIGPILEVIAQQSARTTEMTEAELSRLRTLVADFQSRLGAVESGALVSNLEVRARLDDPVIRQTVADAVAAALGGSRPALAAALSDLVTECLVTQGVGDNLRILKRAIRALDEIDTNQLLLLTLIAFLAPAQTEHATSPTVHAALTARDLEAYDSWLSRAFENLAPKTINFEDIEELLQVGLLIRSLNADEPYHLPQHASPIEALLMRYGITPYHSHLKDAPMVYRAIQLLHPLTGGRLSGDQPILASYWPTPLGWRIVNPLLVRFTDLRRRSVAEESEDA